MVCQGKDTAASEPRRDGAGEGHSVETPGQNDGSTGTGGSNGTCVRTGAGSSNGLEGGEGLLKDTTVTLASRALMVGTSLGIVSATAWLLGPAGKGELSICLVFGNLLVLGLGFGVEMGCAYHAGSGREPLSAVLGTQLVAFGVTSALIIVVGVGCMYSPLPFVHKVPSSALQCAIAYAVAYLLFAYMTVLFMGLGRITRYNLAGVANQGLTLVVLIVGCWAVRNSTVAVGAFFLGALVPGLFLMGGLLRNRAGPRVTFSWSTITACYKYGIKYYFGKLAALTNVQMGVIIISLIGTVEQVGLFSAALGLVNRLGILSETLNIVLLPRILKAPSELAALVVRSCRAALLVTGAAAILLAVLSRPIVAVLLSPAFLPAVGPILVLLPGALLRCLSKVLVAYFNGTGRPGYNSVILVVALTINVALMIVLLPRFGLLGAAAATAAAYSVEALLAVVLFVKVSGTSWQEFLPRQADFQTIASLLRRVARSRPR